MNLLQLFESDLPFPSASEIDALYKRVCAWSDEWYRNDEDIKKYFRDYEFTTERFDNPKQLTKFFNVKTGEIYLPVRATFADPNHPFNYFEHAKPQFIKISGGSFSYEHEPPVWWWHTTQDGRKMITLNKLHDDEILRDRIKDAEEKYYAQTPWKPF